MSAASGGTVERVRLNLRVSKSIKEAYESVVTDKYGRKRPYTGTELERELRFALDDGSIYELYDAISELAEAFGQTSREKKNLSSPSDDTVVVSYRVAEPVRNGIMALASDGDYSNPGKFIERIMHAYAAGEGVHDRLIDSVERIKQATDHKFNDELSAIERRTKAIADELEGKLEFTIDEFEQAIQSVPNISPSDYTREKYLPRVLDELDATWHVNNPYPIFTTATDEKPPEQERDLRNKPYLLMDESDKQSAIKIDFLTSNGRTYSVSDALDVLQGKPQHKTVRKLMRQIGNTSGFEYVNGSKRRGSNAGDILKVNRKAVMNSADHKNLQSVLNYEQTDESDTNDSTSDIPKTDLDATQLQEVANVIENMRGSVDDLHDPVIKRKTAEVISEHIDRDGDSDLVDELFDVITDEQVTRVREYIADGTEQAASAGSEGGDRTAGTTVQQPTPERKLRADGGNVET